MIEKTHIEVQKNYPIIRKEYTHYKGGKYKVLFLSTHSETDEVLVNYQSLIFGSYHSRPLESWNEFVQLKDKLISRFI